MGTWPVLPNPADFTLAADDLAAPKAYRHLSMKKLGSQPVHRVLTTAQVFEREAVPQVQSAPVWCVYVILVIVEMGIGQENRDLLLSPAIKHPESPRGGLQVGV